MLLAVLLQAGCGNKTPLPAGPAGEQIAAGEAAAIKRIIAGFRDKIVARDGDGVTRRGAHPKHHACVAGHFSVRDDLPPELAHGILQSGATYPALVRFSNNADPRADTVPDVRGMAIKLFGVSGTTLFNDADDDGTHDFLLVSHPVFLFADVATYARGFEAIENGNALAFFFNPFDSHLKSFLIARDMQVAHEDLRTVSWSSMVPYQLGPRLAVKYAARSCVPVTPSPAAAAEDDFLAARLAAALSRVDVCFTFSVQRQGDPARMPIEDATVEWDEAAAPLTPVATLTLPAQNIDDAAADGRCERLSYNPWRVLPAHRPLGGINRARRVIYEQLAAFRRGRNDVPSAEPASPIARAVARAAAGDAGP